MTTGDRGRGYAYALGAYAIWGLMPAYFKLLTAARPLDVWTASSSFVERSARPRRGSGWWRAPC
jgi:EamA domain-containing membrane protein RarD